MDSVLGDRKFYVNFGDLDVQEAEEVFRDYFERQPEVTTVLNGITIAGPITSEEVKISSIGG